MQQDHPSSLSDLGRRSRHKTDMVLGRWGLGQIADASPGLAALARAFAATRQSTCFDLESEVDLRRLANPEMVLGACRRLAAEPDESLAGPRSIERRLGCLGMRQRSDELRTGASAHRRGPRAGGFENLAQV